MEAVQRLAGITSLQETFRNVLTSNQLTSSLQQAIKSIHERSTDEKTQGREGSGRPESSAASSSVQSISLKSETSNTPLIPIDSSSDYALRLCNCLEAIFLHAIKTPFVSRFSSVFNPNNQQQPDFWSVVVSLTHLDIQNALKRLENVNTAVGRCRAWVRYALNDGLLLSYIDTLTSDERLLAKFYMPSAYLRDKNQIEILKTLLQGLIGLDFNFNYDSSNLNSWSKETLSLLGMMTEAKAINAQPRIIDAQEPILPAEDVLATLKDEVDSSGNFKSASHKTSKSSVGGSSSRKTPHIAIESASTSQSLSDESSRVPRASASIPIPSPSSHRSPKTARSAPIKMTKGVKNTTNNEETGSLMSDYSDRLSIGGNSLREGVGWTSSPPSLIDDTSTESYQDVLNNYSTHVLLSSTPDMKDFTQTLDYYYKSMQNRASSRGVSSAARLIMGGSSRNSPSISLSSDLDFEIVPKSVVINNSDPYTQRFLHLLTRINTEQGLNQQNYKCKGCTRPIGMIYGESRMCKFDGSLYCTECHANEEALIPARIALCWDFKKYPVSRHNKQMLAKTECEPLLDLKTLAPIIYSVIPEMKQVQALRTQLFYLHAYLFTCQETVSLQLRKLVWPKEHLYEHIHLYSCNDLVQVMLMEPLYRSQGSRLPINNESTNLCSHF